MGDCAKCAHPKTEHRYGYGPCRHVETRRQMIYDVARPDDGREVRTDVVFCGCIRMAS